MLKRVFPFFAVLFILLFSGCSSQIGGLLIGFDKEPVAGALVRLIVIDDEGTELQEVAFTVTNSEGRFDFGMSDSVGASFIVEAVLSEGTLRGFAVGNGSATNLNPIIDAFYRAIIFVTETEGGRNLSDFTKKELREILKGFEDDDTLWDMDLTDTTSLVNTVISLAGRDIPDAAGGEISVVNLASQEPANEVTDSDPTFAASDAKCSRDYYLLQGQFYRFEVLRDGALCASGTIDGSIDPAYSIAYQLSLIGDTFVDTGDGSFPGNACADPNCPPSFVEDNREIAFGPVDTAAGLSVTRKIFVPESSDYARFVEIFENSTGSDLSVTIKITGIIDIGRGGIKILSDSSGNMQIGTNDFWAANSAKFPDSAVPSVGYVWDGIDGSARVDELAMPPVNANFMSYQWDATIPAGQTRVFMHFAYLSSSADAYLMSESLKDIYSGPDETGMSSSELSVLENFPVTRGNIRGESGSVISNEDLTITNISQSKSARILARKDGSFYAGLDAASGDTITVLGAGAKTDFTLTVP